MIIRFYNRLIRSNVQRPQRLNLIWNASRAEDMTVCIGDNKTNELTFISDFVILVSVGIG